MRLRIYEVLRTPGRCDHACKRCAFADRCDEAETPKPVPLALMFDVLLSEGYYIRLHGMGVQA